MVGEKREPVIMGGDFNAKTKPGWERNLSKKEKT